MGLPVFKFTLSHSVLGSLSISEPDGWKDAKLKLERHPDFHSLIEYFEGGFIYYGEDNVDIGGADFIRQVESTYGFDADIVETIDVSFDGTIYENIFTGLKDLTLLQEVKDNKIEVPTIRNSLWTKFISRLDVPVNLRSTTDLDGNPVSPVEPIDINLPSQKLRQQYQGSLGDVSTFIEDTVNYTIPDNQYGQIDFTNETLNEIENKFNLPTVSNSQRPVPLFELEFAGAYQFNITIFTSTDVLLGSSTDPNLDVRIQINDDSAITLAKVNLGINGINGTTRHTYNAILNLEKNDSVRLYFFNNNATGTSYSFVYQVSSSMSIIADTIFPSTEAKGFYIHDVFAGIVQRICGSNSFYSDILGRTDTNVRQYSSNGCYSLFGILKGLQIRGYLLDEKIFSISFNQVWKGANAIFNLGLGPETISGIEYIRLESKSHFYDPTSISLLISNVREISREYDTSRIFNSLQFGYTKWQSEDSSSIDDTQTKREYSTIIKKVNNKLTQHSDFIAASLAIEITRRKKLKKGEDYKYDDDNFIIHLFNDDVSPDRYRPELNENFNSITGLLNSNTRYNTILSPVRSILRWGNFWNGCLQKYQSSSLKFVSGEGNYDMISDYNCTSGNECLAIICDPISEKQDIQLGSPSNYGRLFGYLHLPLLYTVEIINFSWDDYLLIRNNLNKPIAVSQNLDNYKRFFIKELTFELCKSKCRIIMWPYDEAPIVVVNTNQPDRPLDQPFEEDCGERVRLLEDGDERITENEECRNLEDGASMFFYNTSEIVTILRDTDYQNILDYADSQGYSLPSNSQQLLQNQLILDLKASGIWNELDLLYVFATDGDRDFAKINWINPGSFTPSEPSGSLAFTINQGFTGNGTSTYFNTGWIASTHAVKYTQNNASVLCYINNEISSNNKIDFGVNSGPTDPSILFNSRNASDQHSGRINAATSVSRGSGVSSLGFYQIQRTASAISKFFKNGSQVGSDITATSSGVPNRFLPLFANNNNGTIGSFSDRQLGVFAVGSSLSGNESALYTAWNNYFTNVSVITEIIENAQYFYNTSEIPPADGKYFYNESEL